MTETISYMQQNLAGIYPPEEINSFVRLIMDEICGLKPHQLVLDKGRILPDSEKQEINNIVIRLQQQEPIQYILGKSYFYGNEFVVTPSVLIPRPETEELVNLIISEQKDRQVRILDIGTGSGCIAISLAKNLTKSEVSAMDISEEALAVARINAGQLKVDISFMQDNILQPVHTPEKPYHIIVSNPPYVMERERKQMLKNVLDYEPSLALFVPDNDPLLFYRHIALFAKKYLERDGVLYFEINAQCGKEMADMLYLEGFKKVELKQDLSGKDRIIKAQL